MSNEYILVRETLATRLKDSQVRVPMDVDEFLDRLVCDFEPSMISKLFSFVLDQSTQSNGNMKQALDVTELYMDAEIMDDDQQICYIRSYAVQALVMRAIIDDYERTKADNTFVQAWNEILMRVDMDALVYLRYVGTTARSAQQRVNEDHASVNATTLGATSRLKNVLRIASKYVDLRAALTLYEVPWLAIDESNLCEQKQVDAHEIMLVHLLGRSALLNSQPGGFYRSYRPSAADLDAIGMLQLNLGGAVELLQQQVQSRYDKLEAIYSGSADYPHHPLKANKDLRRMTIDQALGKNGDNPCVASPLVLVGDDISAEDMRLKRPFFDGSRSGNLVKDLLEDISSVALVSCSHVIPFADLFTTPCTKNVDLDIKILAKVLEVLKPTIIATIGLVPAQAAKSNFHGCQSMSNTMYKNELGEPFVSNMDAYFSYDDARDDEEPRDVHAIVVPVLHPGYVSYGPGSPVQMRVIFLLLARTLLLMDCAQEVQGLPRAPPSMSKLLCHQVLRLWREKEAKTDLGARIQKALDDYRRESKEIGQERAAKRSAPSDDALRNRISAASTRMHNLAYTTQTKGEPGSDTRKEQLVRLLRENDSCWRTHDDWGTTAWHDRVLNLRQGVSIFHSLVEDRIAAKFNPCAGLTSRQVAYAMIHLAPLVDLDKGDTSILHDKALYHKAMSIKMQQVTAGQRHGKVTYKVDDLVDGRAAIKYFDSCAVVKVGKNGKANMRVVLGDGTGSQSTGPLQITSAKAVAGVDACFSLELDPDQDKRALVIKSVGSNRRLMRNHYGDVIKVPAIDLKRKSPMLFQVYLNTMRMLGLPVDDDIIDDTPWDVNHVICLIWRRFCRNKSYTFSPTQFPECVKKSIKGVDLAPGERWYWSNVADHKTDIMKRCKKLFHTVSTHGPTGYSTTWPAYDQAKADAVFTHVAELTANFRASHSSGSASQAHDVPASASTSGNGNPNTSSNSSVAVADGATEDNGQSSSHEDDSDTRIHARRGRGGRGRGNYKQSSLHSFFH